MKGEMDSDGAIRFISEIREQLKMRIQKRNIDKTVFCPTSVASKVLSQVDVLRVDAEGKAH